jgi:hypothetical protein
MTATIQNFNEATRRTLCAVLAVLIVGAGLGLGAAGADAAYNSAVARTTVTIA